MKDQSIWYLENIDVEGLFCPNKLGDSVAQHQQHLKKFAKNDYIYLPDQASDMVYLITEGRIKIGTYGENGKEITKAIITKGEVFGELAIVGEDTRRDFAQALDNVSVCCIKSDEMKQLLKDHNKFSLFFMKIMGSRVLEMEQRLESLVFKDSRSRIVEFLVNLVAKKGQRVGYEWVVRNFMTHKEIALLTATSRQTVTTVLNELRTNNLLTFNRKRLLIRDLDKLKEEII